MDKKFTPGPWKACRFHEDFHGPMYEIDEGEVETYEAKPFVRICSEHETITAAHDLFEFNTANAHLIAAAPDMYEILSQLEWHSDDGYDQPYCSCCWNFKPTHTDDCKLQAALKKARGEQ